MACEELAGSGADEDQYAKEPPAEVDNPKGVVPDTVTVKKVPDTGGPSYLAIGALILLAAAMASAEWPVEIIPAGDQVPHKLHQEIPPRADDLYHRPYPHRAQGHLPGAVPQLRRAGALR
jgi:hypothetical protein